MANQEHLDILRHGAEAWNKWRKDNREITPDLSSAIFRRADLSRANLSGVDFLVAERIASLLMQ